MNVVISRNEFMEKTKGLAADALVDIPHMLLGPWGEVVYTSDQLNALLSGQEQPPSVYPKVLVGFDAICSYTERGRNSVFKALKTWGVAPYRLNYRNSPVLTVEQGHYLIDQQKSRGNGKTAGTKRNEAAYEFVVEGDDGRFTVRGLTTMSFSDPRYAAFKAKKMYIENTPLPAGSELVVTQGGVKRTAVTLEDIHCYLHDIKVTVEGVEVGIHYTQIHYGQLPFEIRMN